MPEAFTHFKARTEGIPTLEWECPPYSCVCFHAFGVWNFTVFLGDKGIASGRGWNLSAPGACEEAARAVATHRTQSQGGDQG